MRAFPLLALKTTEILVTHLVSPHIDALIGQKVPDRPENVLAVLIGTDVHKRAVDVKCDSGHSGQCGGHDQLACNSRLDCRTSLLP